uniref:Uncharacterized protein n=1 Tax=Solanum lycopersicum TaxID=4081 RepID=A0A3Q7HMM5_SOLLC
MVVPKLQRRNRSRHIDEVINDGYASQQSLLEQPSPPIWHHEQMKEFCCAPKEALNIFGELEP